MYPKTTKIFIVNNLPVTSIEPSSFRLETQPLPSASELKDGETLVKAIAFSNDPAQRAWIDANQDPHRLYVPPVSQGDPMRVFSLIGEVVASKSEKYKQGMRVNCRGGWWEYGVVNEDDILGEAANIEGQSPWISLSLFGLSGLTAYSGVFGECKLEKDQVVVVSSAAGGVGNVFIQIAKKVIGCKRVIGIAGGPEKCDWVRSLGADDCIDYKHEDFVKNLTKALPDEADIFFDNVGGLVLDTMLHLVKRFGRVVACGSIDGYHGKPAEIRNWHEVVYNRLSIRGYIFFDHQEVMKNATTDLTRWLKDGTIDASEGETVVETHFEDVPKVWERIYRGEDKGKLVTKLV